MAIEDGGQEEDEADGEASPVETGMEGRTTRGRIKVNKKLFGIIRIGLFTSVGIVKLVYYPDCI